jgi:hypothetical protein
VDDYDYYNKLNPAQQSNAFKEQKRYLAKYFATWCDYGHLNKYMVTLSPLQNSMEAVISLRNKFIKKINNISHYKKEKVAYFSAIEGKVNEKELSKKSKEYEEKRLQDDDFNLHIHIQFLTSLTQEDIEKAMSRIPSDICVYKHLTPPIEEETRKHLMKLGEPNTHKTFDYVVKDIRDTNWKFHYHLKTNYKGKRPFTSSRKQIANYLITKIYHYFQEFYPKEWKAIKNKYKFLIEAKENEDIIFGSVDNKDNHKRDEYYRIIVKRKKTIDIKKTILSKNAPWMIKYN